MTDGDWHWLRYPYLAEGETPDKWQAARRFLAGHGYRIARVTMSFGDYAWAAPYARSVAAQDAAGIDALEGGSLKAAADTPAWAPMASHKGAGRRIPLALMMTVGAIAPRPEGGTAGGE